MKRALFCLIIFSSLHIWAETSPGVKLQFASGDQIVIQLDENPLIKFIDDNIYITTSTRILQCSSEELLGFTHIHVDHTSVKGIKTDDEFVFFTNDGISGSNIKPDSQFYIYTQDGKLICSSKTDEFGNLHANFNPQKGIIYIIKTSTTSFKMTKR